MGATGVSVRYLEGNLGFNKRFSFMRKLVFLAVIIVLVSMPLLTVTPALAAAPTISPSSGTPGDNVTVSFTGLVGTFNIVFAPATAYEQILASGAIIGDPFYQQILIPPAPWGNFTIRVDTIPGGSTSLPFSVTPKTSLQITSGHVGDTVIINGAGFRAAAGVNIFFGSTSVITLNSDTSGSLSTSNFQVPAARSGTYAVYGTDGLATSPAVYFTLQTHLTASVLTGAVGDRITLTGTGYEYNSPLSFYWDSQSVGNIQIASSSTGTFTSDFIIPPGARGTHSIKVVDNTARQSNVVFTIIPALLLNPANGVPGGTVTLTGTGFHYNATITVTLNGNTIATQPSVNIVDVYGGFTATFTVPSIIGGNYIIRASDDVSAVATTFSVISSIDLSPSVGNVSTLLQVKGSGFTPSGSVSVSYDGKIIATVNTDATGSFTASFSVPSSKAGARIINVTDLATPGVVATATFTMESTPPTKPNLLTPEPGNQSSTTPAFIWSAVTDPSGVTYSLQVARDAAFSQIMLNKQGITAATYQVTQAEAFGLTKKANSFYWRVKAIDGASNESDWTSPYTLYTQDSTPPPIPPQLNPQNDSQADVRPAFTWSGVNDPSGVTYSLQVAQDVGFSKLVVNKQGLDTTNYQVAQAEAFNLTKKTSPYYWRVKAGDGAGNESDWSSSFTFYTQDSTPPPVAISLKPEQGSSQGSQTFFDWADATDPSGVTYTLQVAQDAAFSQLVVVKVGLQISEYKLTSAEKLSTSTGNPPSVYYWRVKAIDGAGNESGWSNTNEFSVRSFLQSGWPLYAALVVGGLLLLGIGIFIGMRLKPKAVVDK